MRKVLAVLILSCTIILVASLIGDTVIGQGQWNVVTVLECDDPEQYAVPFLLTRNKLNRTHDSFTLHIKLDREFNDSYSIEIVSYKEVDGGFKYYYTYTNDSAVAVMKDRIGKNVDIVLSSAGIDPPDFPIPPGDWTAENFVLNYKELPPTCIFGQFDSSIFILFDDVKVSCIRILVSYEEVDDD